jgi:ADP-heptose:LPS heptosyltransferase
VDLNLDLARAAGGQPAPKTMDLLTPEESTRHVLERVKADGLNSFVIINPGAGWPTKRWSPARYGELASRIQSRLGLGVVVTTAPDEVDLFDQISACSPNPRALFHYSVPFLQLVPLIKKAILMIAGDTGPFHLACLLGTPVVAILGPTAPGRNGPWSSLDESVYHRLPCSYCYGRRCPTQNECMDITVEEVFSAVERRLARLQ